MSTGTQQNSTNITRIGAASHGATEVGARQANLAVRASPSDASHHVRAGDDPGVTYSDGDTFRPMLVTDTAGRSSATAEQPVVIDTPPAAPLIMPLGAALTLAAPAPHAVPTIGSVYDDVGLITGNLTNGAHTDDRTPTLSGSGATAGDVINVYDNDLLIGSVVVGSTGAWEYTPSDPLASQGIHVLTVTSVTQEGAESAPSTPFTIILDTIPPSALAHISAISDDTGTFPDDFITKDNTLVVTATVTGTLAAGEKVQISIDGGTTWHDAALVSGTQYQYDATGTPLADGTYMFEARVIDEAGNISTPGTQTVRIDTAPPTGTVEITSYHDDVVPQTGDFYNNSSTNDTSPLLKGTVSGLEQGDVVKVYEGTGANGTYIGDAQVTGGTWSLQLNNLSETSHTYTAVIFDLAGNAGVPSNAFTFTVDITPPITGNAVQITSYYDDVVPQTGDFYNNSSTNDTSPLLKGTVSGMEQGDVVKVYEGTGANRTYVGDAQVTGGNWSLQLNNLSEAPHTYTAVITDSAGNAGTASSPFTLTVDITPPITGNAVEITSYLDDVLPLTGNFGNGTATDDTTPKLQGTVSGLEQGDVVEVYEGTAFLGTATVMAVNGDGTWAYQITNAQALGLGDHTFKAVIADAAGNTGTTSDPFTLTIGETPIVQDGMLKMNSATDDGASVSDGVTSIATPTYDGKFVVTNANTLAALQAGQLTATLFVDKNGDGILSSGDQILASGVKVNPDGSFSTSIASLASGHTYAIQATLVSSIGLASGADIHASATITVSQPGVSYHPGAANLGLGYAVTTVGDFNGDGYGDYLVTAPGAHLSSLMPSGNAYLVYGGVNGLPNIGNLSHLTAAQGIKITGSGSSTGGTVTGQGMTVQDIGDFNGDGLDDFALTSVLSGVTYVIYGQSGNSLANLNLNTLTASQGFSVKWTKANSNGTCFFGASVTGADLNGDGYSDLIVSDPAGGANSTTASSGAVYVIYGHAGTQAPVSIGNTGAIANPSGKSTALSGTGGLGSVVSAVGDVNGDGYTDYVATMPSPVNTTTASTGSAYLIFGGPTGLTEMSSALNLSKGLPSGTGITITANNANERLGGSVASASTVDTVYQGYHTVASLGNIDGSGHNAFAIGSPGAIGATTGTTNSAGAGAVYVLYDQTNWADISLPTYSGGGIWSGGNLNGSNGFVIYSYNFASKANGTAANASSLGFSLSSAGDVNGDGIGDFLIGAPTANNGAGAAFLVFGEAGGLPGASTGVVNLDVLVAAGAQSGVAFGTPGTAIEYDGTQGGGAVTGSLLGTDVTGGDLNGSGIGSYSFGAWGQNTAGGGANSGQSAIYNGTTAYLTQSYSIADQQIYYAGVHTVGAADIVKGVDLIVTGPGNNDWVHGIGTDTTGTTASNVQHDVVHGGAGNDHIGIVGTNFTSVSGGGGWNTLVFEHSNMTLNLADMGLKVQGFAEFDLNNQSNNASTDPLHQFTGQTIGNTLELRLSDVLGQANGATTGANAQHMTILGDSTCKVVLDNTSSLAGSGWSSGTQANVNGVLFDIYHHTSMGANTSADLLIQHGVVVV